MEGQEVSELLTALPTLVQGGHTDRRTYRTGPDMQTDRQTDM